MKAEDYFFMIDTEQRLFCFVTKEYWAEHKYLDNFADEKSLQELLPYGFHKMMESCYEFRCYLGGREVDYKLEKGRQALILAGFDEIPYAW